MAYEQRDNSGTLFKNDKREKDSHPHATGKAMIGGVMYYVSAWTKEGSKGKFQSLSFKPVDEQAAAPKQSGSNYSKAKNGELPAFDDMD